MDRWSPLLACALFVLAGCADVAPNEGTDGVTGPVETASGEVSVLRQGDRYKATRTEVGMVPFSAGDDVDMSTVAGAASISDDGSGKARAMATLWALGDTEQEAREALATVRFELSGPGVQAHVRSPDWQDKGGAIVVQLPTRNVGSLTAEVTAGAIEVAGIHAASMDLETTAGALRVDGVVDDLRAVTSSGAMDMDIRAARSGSWSLTATAGGIDLQVPEDGRRGYDLQAQAMAGGISFDFRDTELVASDQGPARQERHERTRDYAERDIQTQVSLETTAGVIEAGS